MLSQSVLLAGVNDDPQTLGALMRALVECRIKPYYLHHGDLAPGTSHLRTTIERGQDLMRAMRGRLSGLCQPTYVLDIPGGHGKSPIGPNYVCQDEAGGCGSRISAGDCTPTRRHDGPAAKSCWKSAHAGFTPVITPIFCTCGLAPIVPVTGLCF